MTEEKEQSITEVLWNNLGISGLNTETALLVNILGDTLSALVKASVLQPEQVESILAANEQRMLANAQKLREGGKAHEETRQVGAAQMEEAVKMCIESLRKALAS